MQSTTSSQSNVSSSQRNATQGAGGASGSSTPYAKLDGVLSHFYSVTANVIVRSRLIQYRRAQRKAQENQLQTRLTKWFALQIPELDLFKDELRLWRSLSSMLSLDSLGRVQTSPASSSSDQPVPPLVIDVLLDLSGVPDSHVVQLWTRSGTKKAPHFLSSANGTPPAWEDRVPIDGVADDAKPSEAQDQQHTSATKLVVLERWKLEFVPGTPDQVPELPTLYKRSITHFRGLFTLVNALPVGRLCSRIEAAQRREESIAARKAARRDPAEGPALSSGSDDAGELDHELKIGCRLSMTEEAPQDMSDGTVDVDDFLQAELSASRACADNESKGSSTASATSVRRFTPIVTPLGTLHTSVRFRRLVDFSVQDAKSLQSIRDMQIEMDEDFFRPTVETVKKRTASGASGVRPDMSAGAGRSVDHALDSDSDVQQPPAIGLQPAAAIKGDEATAAQQRDIPRPSATSASGQARPQSLLSATAHQRSASMSSGASKTPAGGPNHPVGSMGPPTSIPSHTAPLSSAAGEQLLSRSPAGNTTVFSTSAPGRPVAGLSSLRRTGSITSNVSNLGSSGVAGATPSSPALAAALSAEPAFLALGQPRRPSTSERRMRSISSTSSGRESPTSSVTGTSAPTSSAQAPSTSLRSSLGRVTSGPIPVTSPHLRTGSFSPSSPSPLIQQISLGRPPANTLFPSSSSASSVPAVGSRLSSSPLMRSQIAGPSVPSLRSVFQTYAPSPSSSLSHVTSPSTISLRGSISRRSLGIGASDVGSLSALGTSSTAARPQMIKRYDTNFGYRQASRDQRSAYGSSLGTVDASGVGAAGGDPASLPSSGPGSLGSQYGRSWAARMEQRQQFSAFTRGSTSNDDATSGSASTSIRFRSSPAAGATPTGAYTPSPGSQEGDLDDLMRLIDSKPVLRGASGRTASLKREQAEDASSSGAATPAGEPDVQRASPGSSGGMDQSGDLPSRHAVAASSSNLSGRGGSRSKSGVYASIRGTNPLSRSQVDEMLSRMMQSVNVATVPTPESAAAAGRERERTTSSSTPYQASPPAEEATSAPDQSSSGPGTPGSRVRPSLRGAFDRPASANGMRSATSRAVTAYRGASSPLVGETSDAAAGAFRSIRPAVRDGLPTTSASSSHGGPIGTGQVRGLRTSAEPLMTQRGFGDTAVLEDRSGGALGLLRDRRPDSARCALSNVAMQRTSSSNSLDFGEGRLGYDPVDDEAAGQMEMPTGDLYDDELGREDTSGTRRLAGRDRTSAASTPSGGTLGGGRYRPPAAGGYQITRTRSGTSRSSPSSNAAAAFSGVSVGGGGLGIGASAGVTMDWERGERERQRQRELERRRADAEMARNFGNEVGVGAGTRVRGSRSPWRHGVTSPSAPSSVTHAVGFGAAMQAAARRGQSQRSSREASGEEYHHPPHHHHHRGAGGGGGGGGGGRNEYAEGDDGEDDDDDDDGEVSDREGGRVGMF